MPKQVHKTAFLSVNGVDLSDHVETLDVTEAADMQDKSAMGDASHAKLPGLKDWSVTINFRQNFDAAKVDATLQPLVGAAAFPIIIRPDTGVISATNPERTGNALVESYQPFTGAVGETANAPVTLQGDGDLARATS